MSDTLSETAQGAVLSSAGTAKDEFVGLGGLDGGTRPEKSGSASVSLNRAFHFRCPGV